MFLYSLTLPHCQLHKVVLHLWTKVAVIPILPLSDLSDQKQEMVSAASPSNFVSEAPKVSSVPAASLSSVMPLQVEKVSLPSAVLANGGNVSFSMPEACLDCGDGDIIIGEELDELLDSVPDPDESVMVRFIGFLSQKTVLMSGHGGVVFIKW